MEMLVRLLQFEKHDPSILITLLGIIILLRLLKKVKLQQQQEILQDGILVLQLYLLLLKLIIKIIMKVFKNQILLLI